MSYHVNSYKLLDLIEVKIRKDLDVPYSTENDFENSLKLVKLNHINFCVHSLFRPSTNHSIITQSHNNVKSYSEG